MPVFNNMTLLFPVDSDEVIGTLLNAVKNDNSVLSSSYALLAAAQLDKPNLGSLLKSVDIEVRV